MVLEQKPVGVFPQETSFDGPTEHNIIYTYYGRCRTSGNVKVRKRKSSRCGEMTSRSIRFLDR